MNLNSEPGPIDMFSVSQSLSSVSNKIVAIVLAICVFFSAMTLTLTNGLEFLALLQKVASKYDLYCPEITIIDGKATIREKQPYIVELPQDLNLTVVIDTRDNPKPNPLSYIKENTTGLALLRNSLIVKNRDETSNIKLENFPDLTINSQTLTDEFANYRFTILLFIAIASVVYFGISKIMQTLISAMAISLVTRQLSIPFSFKRGFKLATFVIVPATIVDIALKFFNVLPGSQFYIYLGCYAGTMFWLVKDLITNLNQQTGHREN